jgi:hypothetical protein
MRVSPDEDRLRDPDRSASRNRSGCRSSPPVLLPRRIRQTGNSSGPGPRPCRELVVKRLVLTLVVFSAFTPTISGQTVEQTEPTVFPGRVEIIRGTERTYQNIIIPGAEETDLQKLWSGWLRKVEGAEKDYKNKNGRFGSLADLRKAHLLRNLVFEPCSSAGTNGKAKANFVPKTTVIQVTVSEDGQHFDSVVVDGGGHCYRPQDHPAPQLPSPIYWDSPPMPPTLPG